VRLSNDKILVSHVGSLPRGEVLNELLLSSEFGEVEDQETMDQEIERRVEHVFDQQLNIGIDIVNDGEQGRVGFQTYLPGRMTGFDGQSNRPMPQDMAKFPGFTKIQASMFPKRGRSFNAPQAVDEICYEDMSFIQQEIECLKQQATARGKPVGDCFMNAPSPGIISTTLLNAYYSSREDYLSALAREIKKEYKAIIEAGFLLQIYAPDLAMERQIVFQDLSLKDYLTECEKNVEALNKALEGIAPERVRLHCCWGNWAGPHVHDIPLSDVLPILAQANVGALSIEFANPRHQHEYKSLRNYKLPDNLVLLPGVIDTSTNIVEHPEVVASRIIDAVGAVEIGRAHV